MSDGSKETLAPPQSKDVAEAENPLVPNNSNVLATNLQDASLDVMDLQTVTEVPTVTDVTAVTDVTTVPDVPAASEAPTSDNNIVKDPSNEIPNATETSTSNLDVESKARSTTAKSNKVNHASPAKSKVHSRKSSAASSLTSSARRMRSSSTSIPVSGGAKRNKKKKAKTPEKKSGKKEDDKVPRSDSLTGTLPDFVFPLTLVDQTQGIFNCVADIQVNAENPFLMLKKDAILDDIQNRAAVSDFYPFKEQIQNYAGDELMLFFDHENKYGGNFCIILSEEAKPKMYQFIKIPKETYAEVSNAESSEVTQTLSKMYMPTVEQRPRKWISLGSEFEVKGENPDMIPSFVTISSKTVRKEFGLPYEFDNAKPGTEKDPYVGCVDAVEGDYSLQRIELDRAVQAVPTTIDTFTQTRWRNPRTSCTQYIPREFTEEEKAEIQQDPTLLDFILDVTPLFQEALQQNEITDVFYDDWFHLGREIDISVGHIDGQLKEYQSFCDLQYSKEKAGVCMQWHPTIRGVIAISMAENIGLDERINQEYRILLKPSLILIWSFTDPIHPQLMLEAPEDVFCFQFNPSDPNIIAGGCFNGQVVLWDITEHVNRLKQPRPGQKKRNVYLPGFEDPSYFQTPVLRNCATSSIEHSHIGCVTDLQWLPDHFEISRYGIPTENTEGQCSQLMTCGGDLQVFFWDIRNPKTQSYESEKPPEIVQDKNKVGLPDTFQFLDLYWKPLMRAQVIKPESNKDCAIIKFSIAERQGDRLAKKSDEEMKKSDEGSYKNSLIAKDKRVLSTINTHFYVGTEFGELFYLDWVPRRDTDTGRLQTEKPKFCSEMHTGPVCALKRSYFNKHIILMVGGWRSSLWKEGIHLGPLYMTPSMPTNVIDGCWSLTRASVFFIARIDGTIDVWDMLDRTHEPFLSQNVTPFAVYSISLYEFSAKRQLLAVGDTSGTLHVLEVPRCFMVGPHNELNSFNHYIEREVKRLDYVNERWNLHESDKHQMKVTRKTTRLQPMLFFEEENLARNTALYKSYLTKEVSVLQKMGLAKEKEMQQQHEQQQQQQEELPEELHKEPEEQKQEEQKQKKPQQEKQKQEEPQQEKPQQEEQKQEEPQQEKPQQEEQKQEEPQQEEQKQEEPQQEKPQQEGEEAANT